ncbi:MAG: plasmid maintenance protein CcdB [Archangium gephyra]|uniref:Plasmid maintenance protein CcdB n=1 Tax=Archangium gephyra TaxID=48 RepID=A0A2W5T218_9BACT|nr:MAG: plasmid maintenance protein CcdB [Archangium gephyra]
MKRSALKKPVNLTLSVPLVKKARQLTDNLSGIVEDLLTEYVNREQSRREEERAKLAAAAKAMSDFTRKHGSLADEFSTL